MAKRVIFKYILPPKTKLKKKTRQYIKEPEICRRGTANSNTHR
jgi:hypothetical protein